MTFKEWHRDNLVTLRKYSPDELAAMAVLAGFDIKDVVTPISEWVMRSKRKLDLFNSPFYQHWVELSGYQKTGTEFEEESL